MRIDIFHHVVQPGESKLDKIIGLLHQILNKENILSQELDNLTQTVTDSITVEESAITLIEGLSATLNSIKNDPAAIQALADRLDAEKAKLAAAVTANTPASPSTPGPVA